jgi:hypothetical protein
MNALSPLSLVVLIPTALVVVSVFAVLWRERTSRRDATVAITSGIVLAVWAAVTAGLAWRGFFLNRPGATLPPVGINLIGALLVMGLCISGSRSLRQLLRNRANLIRLHLWRLEGFVFLILMLQGRLQALWALPAGLGDVFIGATAPFIARNLDRPGGRRRAIAWTLFGMADLVVAVGLGVMTNPGPTQVFHPVPGAQMLTQFPLALVPAFLVPLAFTLHVVTLLQLWRGTWGIERLGSKGR